MDTDQVIKFVAVGLVFWALAHACVKFMPVYGRYATQLPLPVYEFFYSITVNIEPSPPTETFSQEIEKLIL